MNIGYVNLCNDWSTGSTMSMVMADLATGRAQRQGVWGRGQAAKKGGNPRETKKEHF